MNDSEARESVWSGSARDGPPSTVLAVTLQRLGGGDLACCCSLALLAREMSGGRRCRVEFAAGGSGGAEDPGAAADPGSPEDPNAPSGSEPAEGGPGWHRIPVGAPRAPRVPEAWLAVERHGGERTPPALDRLSPLAAFAGLLLATHRLAREARRTRREAREVRGVLGHTLRGHLHTAMLQADSLMVGFPEEGEADVALVREQLDDLRDTIKGMAEEIREAVDAPDTPAEPSPGSAAGPRDDLRIPELLRQAAERAGDGEAAPRLDVDGRIPALRADPGQLGPALEELFDLARRSRSTPTVSVRPEGSRSGARIDLSVELDPFPGTGGDPDKPEAYAGPSPAGGGGDGPERPDGEEREEGRPSLRHVVDRLGGRLRVEVDDRTRATMVLILPAGDGG